jgi:monoamine oxidase
MSLFDVIVVGAGLSGLSAAHEIIKNHNNTSVCVLEARDRVGGRLCTETITLDNTDMQCDVGGQWVCNQQTHIMKTLETLGIGHFKQYNVGKSVLYRNGTVYAYTGVVPFMINWFGLIDLQLVIWRFDRMAASLDVKQPWAHPRAKEWDSISVRSYINSMWTGVGQDMVSAFCLCVFGAEPEELSLLFALFYIKSAGNMNNLIETENGAQDSRVEGGAQNIAKKLAERILDRNTWSGKSSCKLEYNCPVQKIVKDQNEYTVTTKTGQTFTCKYLILAIPPALSVRIEYDPPMPSKRDQLCQRYPMAYMAKTNTIFKTAWWRDDNYAGFFTSSDKDFPLTYGFDGTTVNSLVGFLCGNLARKWSSKTKDERIGAILNQYAIMFGKDVQFVKDQFIGFVEKDWGLEPYSRGSPVGILGPGILSNFGETIREPIGNIHFAGTETAYHWNGYMSGAVEAGQRAAREVIEKLSK